MKMSKRKLGISFIIIGLIFVGIGIYMLSVNVLADKSAAKKSSAHLISVKNTSEEVGGANKYLGSIIIEKLGLELPILNEYSDEHLKEAPCRYVGTFADDNLIIAAHNYKSHFGNLKLLQKGDQISIADVGGNIHKYKVVKLVQLDGTAIDEMTAGAWDLTLFTCNLSGKQRVTVRCKRIE